MIFSQSTPPTAHVAAGALRHDDPTRGKSVRWPWMRSLLRLFACLVATDTEVARACPDCALGTAARALVWSQDFAFNLVVALLPFAVVVTGSVLADRIGRPSDDGS
jgi:hypothetical protein